jgi:glycosyltransferase involved in cell wall biosynthesis
MKVSVSITTYNHEEFIAKAIESVLMQSTDFNFEILIGEDDSTDNTRSIVKCYKEKFPEKIRLFLNDRKNVIFINGRPTGRWNFINNLTHARGKYIALLDGDDYWTDVSKLQKQAIFLDNHSEVAICFHSVHRIFEDNTRKSYLQKPPDAKPFYTIDDLIDMNFIATSSCVFRNRESHVFPEWFYKTPMGDWPMHILNAHHGTIGFIDDAMGIYRTHRNSYWFSEGQINNYLSEILTYRIFATQLNKQYLKKINRAISLRYYLLAKLYKQEDKRALSALNFLKCLMVSPLSPGVSYTRLLYEMRRLCTMKY